MNSAMGKDCKLSEQMKWWRDGMRDVTKSGFFNLKHYSKVIQAKNESIYNNLLDAGVCLQPSEKNTDNDNGIR